MVATGDTQVQRVQGPSGLGRILSGFLSATSKPRQKGSFGEANTLYYHPQLKRWVERGKEGLCSSTTTDLPPPPMTNHGLGEAPKRRSVAQRYKLQDNLTVSSVASSDALLLDSPLLPAPPAYDGGVMLAGLCNTDDLMPNSGPPSACSDCSSADSSGSPSSRSDSLMSLARDVRAALASDSSSSASSSRATSACGSTEDTAASHEVADEGVHSFHDFWGFASPFCKADGAPGPSSPEQTQTQEMKSTKPSGASSGSVSILCTVDSALLALNQGQIEPAPKASQSPIVVSGELSVPVLAVDALQPNDVVYGSLELASSECGAGLSRSSSLALSFAEYVHHDSLPEADLFRELQFLQQQQHQDAGQDADDGGATCGSEQQQQQEVLLLHNPQGPPFTVAGSTDVLGDAFSFAPLLAPDSQADSCGCDVAGTQPGACVRHAAAPFVRCRGAAGWPRVPCGCCLQSDISDAVAEAVKVARTQSAEAEAHQPEVSEDNGQQAAALPRCVDGSKRGPVDVAAVDSAVELFKKLRGSLLAAGICSAASHVRVEGSQAVRATDLRTVTVTEAASQQRPAPVAAAGISASLAQAAQKLAGLGLLAPPPPSQCSQLTDARPAPADPRQACHQGMGQPADDVQRSAAAPCMTSAGVQTALSAAGDGLISTSSCKAFLRRMQADWSLVHERIGGIVDDYTALAKQVAVAAVKQMTLERRCAVVEKRSQQLTRQLALEREERRALVQLLEQERQQRLALERQLEEQAEQSRAQAGELETEAACMRADMDELLLCLGQESTKVAMLADALRAAGGDPDTMMEQVEAEFVAKGVISPT